MLNNNIYICVYVCKIMNVHMKNSVIRQQWEFDKADLQLSYAASAAPFLSNLFHFDSSL